MHEVAIMQETLAIALQHARSEGASRIETIALRVGQLSSVVPEALEFAFEVVSRATIAEGATFLVETVLPAYQCTSCGTEYFAADLGERCPTCHGSRPRLCRGRELELAYLEVS